MAVLPILQYPDKRLTRIAKPVGAIDDRLRKLVRDMFDTMYSADGTGLAATQVNIHKRVVVIDVSETMDDPLVLINPKLLWTSADTVIGREGCLSVADVFETVTRAAAIRVEAQDLSGTVFTLAAEDWLASCIQHELDHLNGIVFIDYLPTQKRNRIKTRLQNQFGP
jgi:peptide deformylase